MTAPSNSFFNVKFRRRRAWYLAFGASVVLLISATSTRADTTWDSQELTMNGNPAGSKTQWWFDSLNWSGNNPGGDPPLYLPPTKDGATTTPAVISPSTQTLPGGQGVVYNPQQQDLAHPDGDPNFTAAQGLTYPTGFGPQIVDALYIARNSTNQSVLTVKGDLTVKSSGTTGFRVGFSGSTAQALNEGKLVQLAGKVSVPTTNLDISSWEATGWGNGVYDYRGGILDVYNNLTGHGIRITHGSQANGTGGIGRIIMHNPATEGYVRTYTLTVASDRTNGDGITRGVGVVEFHFENGNTRPIQVMQNLSLNNGLDNSPQGSFPASTRSSRLSLVLDAAPTVDGNGVPQALGLIDVNSQGLLGGTIGGTGDLDGDATFNNDRVFSSADGVKDYYPRNVFTSRPTLTSQPEDNFLVSAIYNGTLYKWEVTYTGNIVWADVNAGTLASVSDTGGVDVVLKGVSSGPANSIPGDFNNNGVVDAADYVLWRKNQRTTNVLANDPYGPLVSDSQFALWRSNFGKTIGQGAGTALNSGAVPEPGAMLLVFVVLMGAATLRCCPARWCHAT